MVAEEVREERSAFLSRPCERLAKQMYDNLRFENVETCCPK